jgi:iron(III) transport system substrate-binding protein
MMRRRQKPARPPTTRAAIGIFLSCLVGSQLLTGCNRGTSSAAKSSILVYTALEQEQVAPLLEAFKSEHPDVDVQMVRDSTGVVTAKLLAEADNPRADVFWGVSAISFMTADGRGLLEPYAPLGLEHIDARFRDSRDPPHWVGTDVIMTAFSINTAELAKRHLEVPHSYEDLAQPQYKGLITMPSPASSGTGYFTVAGVLQAMGEEKGWQYLERLHTNVAEYAHSGSKPAEQAAEGEYAIGISFDYRGLVEKKGGAPLAVVFPTEKSGWDVEATALVHKAAINPAARVFDDWVFSKKAFEIYAHDYGVVASDEVVPVIEGYPPHPRDQLAKNDFAWMEANHDRIIAEWTRRFGGKGDSKG